MNLSSQIDIVKNRIEIATEEKNYTERRVWEYILESLTKLEDIQNIFVWFKNNLE